MATRRACRDTTDARMVAMLADEEEESGENVPGPSSARRGETVKRDRFFVRETDVVVLQVHHPLFAAQRDASAIMITLGIREARKNKKRANLAKIQTIPGLTLSPLRQEVVVSRHLEVESVSLHRRSLLVTLRRRRRVTNDRLKTF